MEMVLKRQRELKKNGKKGFTLVELIVVIVILAILAAIAVPALTGYIDKAKDEGIASEGRTIGIALKTVAADAEAANVTLPSVATAASATLPSWPGGTAPYATYQDAVEKLTGSTFSGTITDISYSANVLSEFKYTQNGKTFTYSTGLVS